KLDMSDLVFEIKELKKKNSKDKILKVVNKFQSYLFRDNLLEFVEELRNKNNPIVRQLNEFQLLEENETFITLRVDLNEFQEGITGSSVLLINKKDNRLVADRVYDEFGEIVKTTFYGYSKGEIESLDAIRNEEPMKIDDGSEIIKVSLSKITNLNFSIN
ncbi:hypothetical protein, partial [Belliella pelovolcani]|uniref:hypothetical protein n=1 Tax=Belliella pelovolcani TaxID=529505 RepID=UPI00391A7A03